MSPSHVHNVFRASSVHVAEISGIVTIMKALKSQLAKDILSDPRGTAQLRAYLASRNVNGTKAPSDGSETYIEAPGADGKKIRFKPVLVTKAA